MLQIALRVEPVPSSQLRIVRDEVVKVDVTKDINLMPSLSATSLATMAERAAAAVRNEQNADGYWLTFYTSSLKFERPLVEMNTFLTAMMADFLSPIAHTHGLASSVERAREHLAKQIEGNGLVRYHGLPNGPTIGTLGYVITPDSDDTALAWRIAGAGATDPRLTLMLKELASYRDGGAFYKTWLAPQELYQSLNPGRDPNPVDATIQMHVYLMLRELDPPAAQDLCGVLQKGISDDALWVYYAKAPLIPYLRSVELRERGCALPLPIARL